MALKGNNFGCVRSMMRILEIINKNHLINSQRLSSSQNKPEQNIKVGKKKAKNEIYYCLFLII